MTNGGHQLPDEIKTERGSCLWFAIGSVLVALVGLVSVPLLLFLWPPQMGIGLAGGVRLVYEVADEPPGSVDAAQGTSPGEVTPELLRALDQRLDPSRTKQVIVGRLKSNQVEILLPAVELPEYERVKRIISSAGFLQFLIVANPRDQVGSLPVALKTEPIEEVELPPNPAAIWTARSIVLTGVIVLALAWLLMLVRYRWFGAAGVLANIVRISLTLAMLVLLATFEVALIATIVIGVVVVAACNALACEFIRAGRGLQVVCVVAALFLFIGVAAAGMYAVGDFALRNIALAVLATFLTALFTHALQWLLPAVGQRLL